MVEPLLDLSDRRNRVAGIREVDLDVILGPGFPRTILRERMARAGDHAPAGGGEALHGRVPDPAARTSQEQRPARLIIV
jgi:hypothetical protein